MRVLVLLILTCICCSFSAISQDINDRALIIQHTNVDELHRIAQDFQKNQLQYADRQVSKVIVDSEGISQYFSHFNKDGEAVYYQIGNESSAISSNIDKIRIGGESGLDLSGEGIVFGLWDNGNPRFTHQELEGKIVRAEIDDVTGHSTQVAGILVANGVEPEARGMASEAIIDSYNSGGWLSEVAIWAANGGMITNHSYIIANPQEQYQLYGIYNEHSQNWDALSYNAPYLVMCTGASNNGNDGYNPDGSRYDLLASNKLGKNSIVVGACEDVLEYTGPQSVEQAVFTSWGPTDDWRIKPDITAVGTNNFSSRDASDTDYRVSNGSSLSSPIVAGGLGLLQQHYHNLTGVYMKAATAKALIFSTTDEAGEFDGPDFANGWGLFNAQKAANLISNMGINSSIQELNLNENEVFEQVIEVDGSGPVSISMVWNDPPAEPLQFPTPNNPSLMLINDLDMRLVAADGTNYYPWRMEPNDTFDNYTSAAEKGDNYRDNTEIIFENDLPEGQYSVIVSHKGNLQSGMQEFSLVMNGISGSITPAEDFENKPLEFAVYPNPTSEQLFVDLDYEGRESLKLSLVNELNQIQLTQTIDAGSQVQLNLKALMPGLYIVQIETLGGQLKGSKKIVIE